MTIASEITRLQWAKADIKTSIENKGVAVPSATKLDDYAPYIDQIDTGVVAWLFTPVTLSSTFYMNSALFDSDLWDAVKADNSEYYRYFRFRERTSSTEDFWHVWIFTKKHHANQVFTYNSGGAEEPTSGTLQHELFRMKKDGNDIKASVLYYSKRTGENYNWYCYNITNSTVSSPVSLGSTPSGSSWPSTAILEAWTTSCWITAEESIPSINATSMNITRQEAWVYSAVATLNV